MDDVIIVTVDPGVAGDSVQNVLKILSDVAWQDFELLVGTAIY